MISKPFIAGCFLILVGITPTTTAQPTDCNANGIPDICDVGPCACGAGDNLPDATLTVEIFTDAFPAETTWELAEQTVGVFASGGPFDQPHTLFTQDVSVCNANCYDFTIFDAFGDGICCALGNGFYNLVLDGVVIATGGAFTNADTVSNIGACAAGTDPDCNVNGIPDECDIAGGMSQDCNTNGIPDECDILPFPEKAKLIAEDAASSDTFGGSVSISGDTAVIGSKNDDDGGFSSGSASVFVRDAGVWTQQAKLNAADAATGDLFGWSVSIDGDTVVIGSPHDDDAGFSSGSAYVFVRDAGVWTQQAKLNADDAAHGDLFGYSVSISGDTAVIGSFQDDNAGLNSGSAYVFLRTAGVWTQQVKLTADDAAPNHGFGAHVSINGDTVIIGSPGDNDAGFNSGSAYIFVRTDGVWTQQAKLTPADATQGDLFGISVSISDNTAVIGSSLDDDAGDKSGSAYVFVRSGTVWIQYAKLTADDAASRDQFGTSVSISGHTAVIGSKFDDDAGVDSGSAYVFVRTAGVWTQQAKLTADDAASRDEFGTSVTISGHTVITGSPFNSDAGTPSGSAYVFSTESLDCQADGIPDECQLADGTSLDGLPVGGDGLPDECQSDCNGNLIPDADDLADGTSLDCNINGVPDVCDVAGGTSHDCNGNDIPDECDIGVGLSHDCNANGVPDECDLADGTSQDCQLNGIPDDCEGLFVDNLDAVHRGWWKIDGSHDSTNNNTFTGQSNSGIANSYFVFDVSAVDIIDNATLRLEIEGYFGPDPSESVTIYDVSTDAETLEASGLDVNIFDDLQSGNTYATFTVTQSDVGSVLEIPLNAQAVTDINASSGFISVGLHLDDIGLPNVFEGVRFSLGDEARIHQLVFIGIIDCNSNGIIDECDIAEGASLDNLPIGGDGIPDECQADCNGNFFPDTQDIAVGTSQDCNANDVPDECDIAGGISQDCQSNGIPDECELCCNGSIVYIGTDPASHHPGHAEAVILTRNATQWAAGSADPAIGYAAGFQSGDVQTILTAAGFTNLTALTPGDLATANLSAFEVLYVGVVVNGLDFAAAQANVQGFVDAGGGLVAEAEVVGLGSWDWLPFSGLIGHSGDTNISDEIVAIVDPSHPVMAGLTDAGLSNWFVSIHSIFATPEAAGFVRLANDASNGSATIIALPGSPPKDCNANDIPDECDIAEGTSLDDLPLGGDGIPDECQADCNGNLIPDAEDIANGTSQDCNANDTPDECDIAAGTSQDCNTNGIPDECDIGGGPSADCNANGTPDECDIADGASQDCQPNGIPDECDLFPFSQQAKFNAADAAAGDQFGLAVSISGDTAVIGSAFDNDAGSDSGSAYIFVRTGDTWTQQAKLTADDADDGDWFGISVSISGDTAVIGSTLDDDAGVFSGSAYIFVRSAGVWTQQAKLTADDAAFADQFGFSVSINGDTAVIGSPGDRDEGSQSGSAYVFVRTAGIWTQQAKLTADDAAGFDQFGNSVSISGNTSVIGSRQDNDAGTNSGSAYIFVRTADTWTQQVKLTAADAEAGDLFGWSVSINSDTAFIGSPNDSDAGSQSGSAYVFVRSAGVWSQQAKLTAADAVSGQLFGNSVSTSSETAVIGSPWDDVVGSNSGSAYIFFRNAGAWTQQAKISAIDSEARDQFGVSVSISGDAFVVGAFHDNDAGSDSGSAYVFTLGSSDCQANGIPDECEIADGTSHDCNANGIPDECDGFVDTKPPVINCEIVSAPEDDSDDNGDNEDGDDGEGDAEGGNSGGNDDGDGGNDGDASQQSGVVGGSGLSSDQGNAVESPPTSWTENPFSVPNGQIDTIIQTGFGLIAPPGNQRHGIPISDVGYDGPVMLLFDATDDCGPVTLSAILDIGCEQIPVENGTLIDFECKEGDDSGDCEAEEEDGILEIEAATAVITVTATDETGNTSTCEIILCTPPIDGGDNDGSDDSGDDGGDDDSDEGDDNEAAPGPLNARPTKNRPRLTGDQPTQAARQQPSP